MASLDGAKSTGTHSLRHVDVTLRSEERFPVPQSDGYSVYSALLSILADADEAVARRVHDSSIGSVHSSGLLGPFGGSDRRHHKTVLPGETYRLSIGVVDPADTEIFQALVTGLVLDGDSLELSHGSLRVESFQSENESYAEILSTASDLVDPSIEMRFETPTCIEEAGDVTTMVPHRWAVFNSLLGKWNRSCPDELAFDLGREAVLSGVIEKPDARSYDTHSVLVNRVENEDGENRNIFRQGFTGECTYEFKDASESVENAITALAVFGEYSGIGSAVSRGCGSIETTVKQR